MKYMNKQSKSIFFAYRNLTAASAFCRPKSAITLSMPMMKNGDDLTNGMNGNFNFAGLTTN